MANRDSTPQRQDPRQIRWERFLETHRHEFGGYRGGLEQTMNMADAIQVKFGTEYVLYQFRDPQCATAAITAFAQDTGHELSYSFAQNGNPVADSGTSSSEMLTPSH